MADIDPAVDKEHLEQRAALLKKAAALDPRSMDYWTALAKTDEAAKDFTDAQKAWSGAERAAATDQEREHIRKIRLDVQAKRFDEEAAERKRAHDEEEADIARVKAQSDAAIHASEDAARRKMNPNGAAVPKPQAWYEAPTANSSVQGVFQRLDCLDTRARLVIQTADGKTTQLADGRSFASLARWRRRKNVQLWRPKTGPPRDGTLQREARCKAEDGGRSGSDRIPVSAGGAQAIHLRSARQISRSHRCHFCLGRP